MRTYLDCIPCFFKQALETARLAEANQKMQKRVLDEVAKALPEFSLTSSPVEMGGIIHRLVKKIIDKDDPFKKIKKRSNQLALSFYPKLTRKISEANDKLLAALKLAITGNIIDYGVNNSLNVDRELKRIMEGENNKRRNKGIFNYSEFKRALKKTRTIIYLADNAGETVFDRILIEEIKKIDKNKKIIYTVKEKPVINDALIEDAYECGIDKIADVVSCGLDTPGTILSLCSREFLNIYREADMVISKGQGNFEAFSDRKKQVFFLFMAKCPVVARDVGCNVGDINLLYDKTCYGRDERCDTLSSSENKICKR